EKLVSEGELPEKEEFDHEQVVSETLEENPDAVEDIKGGKDQAIGFLVGQVMQKTQGQADPEQANKMLRERITS
ncbi:MAG: Asp-tRNA(Asn)/Glu-tRNA(Gln) amidotransferase GatCAB subunit B, partial [bacterium]